MVLDISAGEKVRSSDIDSLIAGIGRDGTVTGMTVTQRGAGANMSVDVASGSYVANNTGVTKSATTNVVITAADPSNPRIDIIVGDSAGAITAVAGTPASSPNPPQVPSGKVRFAFVNVAAATTSIVNANIQDARIFIKGVIKTAYAETAISGQVVTSLTTTTITGTSILVLARGDVNMQTTTSLDYRIDTVVERSGFQSVNSVQGAAASWQLIHKKTGLAGGSHTFDVFVGTVGSNVFSSPSILLVEIAE